MRNMKGEKHAHITHTQSNPNHAHALALLSLKHPEASVCMENKASKGDNYICGERASERKESSNKRNVPILVSVVCRDAHDGSDVCGGLQSACPGRVLRTLAGVRPNPGRALGPSVPVRAKAPVVGVAVVGMGHRERESVGSMFCLWPHVCGTWCKTEVLVSVSILVEHVAPVYPSGQMHLVCGGCGHGSERGGHD